MEMLKKFPEIKVRNIRRFGDVRGYFEELFNAREFEKLGIPTNFVQDNFSKSPKGVLRGMHFQHPDGQGKLIQILQGKVLDVIADVRLGSPTFGQWASIELSEEVPLQIYIPPGFAHGFCTLSESVLFFYKVTNFYDPKTEKTIIWNDEKLGINWPIQNPTLSAKDIQGKALLDFAPNELPRY